MFDFIFPLPMKFIFFIYNLLKVSTADIFHIISININSIKRFYIIKSALKSNCTGFVDTICDKLILSEYLMNGERR